MSGHRAILFDLDGTLVDTAPDLAATMNVLLERHGRPALELQSVRHLVGEGARVMMARAWAETGRRASEEQLDDLFDDFLEYYINNVADHSSLFPGVEEVLQALVEGGARLAICTNKPDIPTHKLLDALNLTRYFGAIIGADTLSVRKPDPAPLLEAIERLDGQPQNAIMIGDSATDIHAARAANLPVIAVSFGYTREPVQVYEPDLLVDHFQDLPEAIDTVFSRKA
jgi:phosphoglycolate phosphatase